MQEDIPIPGRGRPFRSALAVAVAGGAAVAALVALALMIASGVFSGEPEVQARPHNDYDKTIHMVADVDYEPFSYLDADGEPAGLDVELAVELANRLHMNLDLELVGWDEVNAAFRSGRADAVLNMESDSAEADESMVGSLPYVEKQYVVYGRRQISAASELYGSRVASLHALSELGLSDNVELFGSYGEVFQSLVDGSCDFAVAPVQVGSVFVSRMGLEDVRSSIAVGHVYGVVALPSADGELKHQVDDAIFALQEEGVLDRLEAKWVTERYQDTSLAGMLRAHPSIAVAGVVALVVVMLLLALVASMRRAAAARDAYNARLRENLETIRSQNEELVEARDVAEAGNRAKTAFFFNMSHDIRTPMNAIIGYAELARRDGTTADDMRLYLEKIGDSGQRLLALVNDVLEMSRIESGKMELDPQPTDLAALMDGARDLFQNQMDAKGIAFESHTEGVGDRWALCDADRLDRVLLNLLSNALKFTPEGGHVSAVLTQVGREGETALYELRVADDGIGMSPEFAERVFESFERERTSTVSGIQGTGLGMAITKSIVDAMGGDISVETAPGEGTAFTVRLGFPAAEPPAGMADAADAAGGDGAGDAAFQGKRLLLAEDNDINREIATALLEDMGFAVDSAEDGRGALRKLEAAGPGTYDVVVTDVQMPVMGGYELARAIRSLPDGGLSGIPIVAMTANAFAEDVQAARDAGMDGHIAKPLDVGKMREELAHALGSARQQGD